MTAPGTDRPRLLFVCLKMTSFVGDDLDLLRERYDVRVFQFGAAEAETRAGRAAGLAAHGVRQLAWLLRELPRADLVYGWFVDYHMALPTLLAKAFGVPVAIAVAGFDAIELPALHYGVYHTPWRAKLARRIVHDVDLLLPVSETMIRHQNRYSAYPDELRNGVQHHVPGFSTDYEVVPFGYDLDAWPMGAGVREPVVCTVGHVPDDRTLRRKGIDLFFEAARLLPQATFQVVGMPPDVERMARGRYDPPDNVVFVPPVPREELAALYGRAAVYAQLSRAEGQPNVLCEAMCCGCIPVGSPVFGIPETIGDTGVVVNRPLPAVLAGGIQQALAMNTAEARQRVRRRMQEHYTRAHRRTALTEALEALP